MMSYVPLYADIIGVGFSIGQTPLVPESFMIGYDTGNPFLQRINFSHHVHTWKNVRPQTGSCHSVMILLGQDYRKMRKTHSCFPSNYFNNITSF